LASARYVVLVDEEWDYRKLAPNKKTKALRLRKGFFLKLSTLGCRNRGSCSRLKAADDPHPRWMQFLVPTEKEQERPSSATPDGLDGLRMARN
jgi:hypothetical protein